VFLRWLVSLDLSKIIKGITHRTASEHPNTLPPSSTLRRTSSSLNPPSFLLHLLTLRSSVTSPSSLTVLLSNLVASSLNSSSIRLTTLLDRTLVLLLLPLPLSLPLLNTDQTDVLLLVKNTHHLTKSLLTYSISEATTVPLSLLLLHLTINTTRTLETETNTFKVPVTFLAKCKDKATSLPLNSSNNSTLTSPLVNGVPESFRLEISTLVYNRSNQLHPYFAISSLRPNPDLQICTLTTGSNNQSIPSFFAIPRFPSSKSISTFTLFFEITSILALSLSPNSITHSLSLAPTMVVVSFTTHLLYCSSILFSKFVYSLSLSRLFLGCSFSFPSSSFVLSILSYPGLS